MGTATADAGSDVVIDLSTGATLPTSQVLDGSASASTGGATITGYQWYLLDKPSGSSGALSSSTVVGPTLNSIDVWGTYRLFLVVTDSDGDTSEGNPLLAPDAAFVQVRVRSQNAALVKPAKGERNWHSYGGEHIQETEDLRYDLDNQTIADHDTSATGQELDYLTDGSYATSNGLSGGTSLHKHTGPQVDLATTSTQGVVYLAEAASPQKVMVKAYGAYTTTVDGTHTAAGYLPGVLTSQDPAAAHSLCHAAFFAHHDLTVTKVTWAMRDGGVISAGGYRVRVYILQGADYLSNTFNTPIYDSGANQVPLSDGAPMYRESGTLASAAQGARDLICVRIDGGHALVAQMGSGLTINIGWTLTP